MTLTTGEISADREIIISLSVQDDTVTVHEVRCVLDTGFAGHLTLSESAIDMLRLSYLDTRNILLAGNEPRTVRRYEARIVWRQALIAVPVLEIEGQPLVGMRLLYGSDLHAHIVDGGFATIAAL